MSRKSKHRIPFDAKGNQLHYPDHGCVMADNHEFTEELTYDTYSRGRSAAYFELKRPSGLSVVMFLTDFQDVVPLMERGKVLARWTFCKRGQNYGVQLVKVAA